MVPKFNKRHLVANFMLVLVFALLYYAQDKFMLHYERKAIEWGLLSDKYDPKFRGKHGSDFWYYLWYSLITQTTIGYAGVVNAETGVPVPFSADPNRVFKSLNVLQLVGVLGCMALL